MRICKHHVLGKCSNGNNCTFDHCISIFTSMKAHKAPIKTMCMMPSEKGPKLLTGSDDKSIHVYNMADIAQGR
jgi:hypothetical protein